ncbi:MAG TPA: DUF397 domain-containing protein [Pseudonocardiaceae bacterium]|jgi:hypothetical protein|nr:DUF397 domain-containing protein [Pseudonocardiaceae bacterium]
MTDQRWCKSSYSNGATNCVELANTMDAVRDTKNRTGPALSGDLAALVAAVKAGRLVQ